MRDKFKAIVALLTRYACGLTDESHAAEVLIEFVSICYASDIITARWRWPKRTG